MAVNGKHIYEQLPVRKVPELVTELERQGYVLTQDGYVTFVNINQTSHFFGRTVSMIVDGKKPYCELWAQVDHLADARSRLVEIIMKYQ